MSKRRSTSELWTHGTPGTIRTCEMSVCKTDAFDLLATGANGASGRIRTDTVTCFEQVAATDWATLAILVHRVRFELTLDGF